VELVLRQDGILLFARRRPHVGPLGRLENNVENAQLGSGRSLDFLCHAVHRIALAPWVAALAFALVSAFKVLGEASQNTQTRFRATPVFVGGTWDGQGER